MKELIARLEKATGQDRELDDAISWRVDHPRVLRYTSRDEHDRLIKTAALGYTKFIDASLLLVPPDCLWNVRAAGLSRDANIFGATAERGGKRFEALATTPAIALCIAALKARSD
jgi:hypothetical protein